MYYVDRYNNRVPLKGVIKRKFPFTWDSNSIELLDVIIEVEEDYQHEPFTAISLDDPYPQVYFVIHSVLVGKMLMMVVMSLPFSAVTDWIYGNVS